MKPVALALAAAALPLAAHAGETACWFEQGVIVAPASIDGLAGDYIVDTGSPLTQLHETKAQSAGLVEQDQRGPVRIAGLTLPDRPFVIADLDARTYAFPTPIAGVIGADLLSAYVVEVSFAPCKIAIYPRAQAPPVRSKVRLLPPRVARRLPTPPPPAPAPRPRAEAARSGSGRCGPAAASQPPAPPSPTAPGPSAASS